MRNRFLQQQMPDNDKDKFELACKLVAKKMQADTGMPEEVAREGALVLVSQCMHATERLREKIQTRWRQLSAQGVN